MVRFQTYINKKSIFEYGVMGKNIVNRSLKYIYPLLYKKSCYNILNKHLICCAIRFDLHSTTERFIYVVCYIDKDHIHKQILDQSDYYYKLGNFSVYGFKVEQEDYYDNFIQGKYSKMNYFSGIKDDIAKLVLERSEAYKKALQKYIGGEPDELDSMPNIIFETIHGED